MTAVDVFTSFEHQIPASLRDGLMEAARRLYDEAQEARRLPPPPERFNSVEGARYREALAAIAAASGRDDDIVYFCISIAEQIMSVLPEVSPGPFDIPITDLIPNVRQLVENIILSFSEPSVQRMLPETCATITANYNSSAVGTLLPTASKLPESDIVRAYLGNTPLEPVFSQTIPWDLPDHLRTQHGVIVSRSGGGKSQLLECLIARDLDQRYPPAVVVIDSKRGARSLLERIAHLDVFHPETGRLRDRLIIIDPVKDKPALNPFDIPLEAVNDRITEIAAMIRYFLRELLGNELSSQMNLLFIPLLHVVLRVPGATLETFMDVMENPLHPRYSDIIEQLPAMPKRFLLTEYNSPDNNFRQTKASIRARLYEILMQGKVGDLFGAPRNAVNFADAFRQGKTILISTDDSPQGLSDLSPVVGRFFISRIVTAGLELGAQEEPTRVHLYFDECQPYVDDELGRIFTRLRSNGIGAMVAFQQVEHMGSQVSTIKTNTAIKFMGSVREPDAKAFASDMGDTEPEFIMAQRIPGTKDPKWTKFACFTEELERAIPLTIPIGSLNNRQMPEEAYRRLRVNNRKKVSVPPNPPAGKTKDRSVGEANPQDAPQPQRPKVPPKKPPDDAMAVEDDF